MEILIANGAVVITLSRHKGSAKMTAEMLSIIGVGVATVSLGVATISLTWRMNSTLRQEMTDSFKEVRRDVAVFENAWRVLRSHSPDLWGEGLWGEGRRVYDRMRP